MKYNYEKNLYYALLNNTHLRCLINEDKCNIDEVYLQNIVVERYNMDFWNFIEMLEVNKILYPDFVFNGRVYRKYYKPEEDMQIFRVIADTILDEYDFLVDYFSIWCSPITIEWFDKNFEKWQSTYLAYKLAK